MFQVQSWLSCGEETKDSVLNSQFLPCNKYLGPATHHSLCVFSLSLLLFTPFPLFLFSQTSTVPIRVIFLALVCSWDNGDRELWQCPCLGQDEGHMFLGLVFILRCPGYIIFRAMSSGRCLSWSLLHSERYFSISK